jgi:peptidoglycan-N-acetylglucosamine deacetylase
VAAEPERAAWATDGMEPTYRYVGPTDKPARVPGDSVAAPHRVALTFDAEHPDRPRSQPNEADELLDLLGATGVRATFFVVGRWAEAYPTTARRIAAEGHVVGNHSFFHASFPLLSDEGLVEDVTRADIAIRNSTGVDPHPWFRLPFGHGIASQRVLSEIERLGYWHVGWDLDARDWEPERTVQEITTTIVQGAISRRTCVVLLHDWPWTTVPAVAAAIETLRSLDVAFVTVDQLADTERPRGLPSDPEEMR